MVSGTIADYSALSTTNAVNVGLDIGNRSWLIAVRFYRTGELRQFSFRGKDCAAGCLAKIRDLAESGHDVHVTCEIGRDGFSPARQLRQLGVAVTILPVNRLEVICSGKRVKTDRIDAIFLSTLDPRLMPLLPAVWTPPVQSEERRRILREKRRFRTCQQRVNNQIISIRKRWPVFIRRAALAESR